MVNCRGNGGLGDPARFLMDPQTPNYFVELGAREFSSLAGSGTGDGEELKKKPVGKTTLENLVPV